VRLSLCETDEGLQVDVRDNGPGLTPEEQRVVFEKFRQGEHDDRQAPGHRPRLPISRQIVEHYGGRLWVESVPGEGRHSHFLCLAGNQLKGRKTQDKLMLSCAGNGLLRRSLGPGTQGRRQNGQKILIADDEQNIVISLEFLMKREGFTVCVATDGQEAIDKVRSEAPDLVLLDIMMPRKNGYEVCQEIRTDPGLQGTRILMLTAKGREMEITKGLAMGADAYMTKPFSTRELVTKVKALLDLPA
jgi:CheY-like chemotaxis protein